MSNLEDEVTPLEDNEQERDGSEAISPRKRNGSSAQGGDGPNSKRFRIIIEEEEYKWSHIWQAMQTIIWRNISQEICQRGDFDKNTKAREP